MAGKKQIVKLAIQSSEKSLVGYTVLGDVTANGTRTLVLERPEAATAPARRKAKKAAPAHGPATSFPAGAVANG